MAKLGTALFDANGTVHKTPEAATESDIAAVLGKVGEGESLAPGIARTILQKRAEIEALFAEHDKMMKALALPTAADAPRPTTGLAPALAVAR